MKLSRRKWLQGASAFALTLGINPVKAWTHGSGTSFNGGLTQFNTSSPINSGDFTFINLMKMAQQWSYSGTPSDPTAPPFPISELDADGYITSVVAGTTGVNTVFQMPTNSEYSGNWQLAWDGTGTVNFVGAANTVISGSPTSSPLVFTRTGNAGVPTVVVTTTSAAPNNVRNIRLTKVGNDNTPYGYAQDDATLLASGVQFSPQNVALIKSLRPGVIRSLGWGGIFNGTNESCIATWGQRMPRTYWSYSSFYANPAIYGGRTTSSGSDYTLAYGGFSLTNKVQVTVLFNAAAPQVGQINVSSNTTSGQPIQVSWTGHGLAVGNTVAFGNNSSPPAPLVSATTYFIKTVVDANTFTVSATSGGSVISATNTATGVIFIGVSIPRINVNSTGFVPISALKVVNNPANVFLDFGNVISTNLCNLTYDSTFGYFFLRQGGFISGVPPEVFVDYCAVIGSHPHLITPYLSVEPVSDFMTSWATYATTSYPWMKPRVEPPNETWNPQFASSYYAETLASALWGVADLNEGYGKWCSTLGQAISAIYGNDRTKYSMICSIQTASAHSGTPPDARLKSTLYHSQNGGSEAFRWVDRVCGANYYSPTERFTCQELIDAYAYSVTDAGNPTAQATIANNYAATASFASGDTVYTLAWMDNCFTNLCSWAKGMPVGNTIAGVTCYEGGWSPDYLGGNWSTNITGATKANPCVLTLASTSQNSEQSGMTGNPAVVGMSVTPSGIVGMTQLNGNTYTVTAVSGNLVTINVDSSAFTTYTSGGLLTYVNSMTYSNTLRTAGGNSTQCGTLNTALYALFAAHASGGFVAEYPSNFSLTGTGNVWAILNPDIYASLTPQWNSIVAANH